jgi:hypothetical protein
MADIYIKAVVALALLGAGACLPSTKGEAGLFFFILAAAGIAGLCLL